jgi:hypothetical protein
VYKNGSVQGLSVETVTIDEELRVSLVSPIVAFEFAQNNMRFRFSTREDYKLHIRKIGVYCGNVEIIAIRDIYEVFASSLCI